MGGSGPNEGRGQGGCEPRIEVFVKMQKKSGVRVWFGGRGLVGSGVGVGGGVR